MGHIRFWLPKNMMGAVKVCETIRDHRPMESGTDVNLGHTITRRLERSIWLGKDVRMVLYEGDRLWSPTRLWACGLPCAMDYYSELFCALWKKTMEAVIWKCYMLVCTVDSLATILWITDPDQEYWWGQLTFLRLLNCKLVLGHWLKVLKLLGHHISQSFIIVRDSNPCIFIIICLL